ncbi:PaaX family transcriptional regulator C-terminal domain-containing protein [Verrucomicrobiota bacterium]
MIVGKKARFHDPDLSWSVFRRRFGSEALHLIGGLLVTLSTRGKPPVWSDLFPERRKCRDAMYRLKRDGLIAERGGAYRQPTLILTEEGRSKLNPAMDPERFWRRRWFGTWFVLVYDVPEEERAYRDALRGFLQRKRMGQLQRSVWVSPDDIRGEFADLRDAAGLDEYAFLLESQTLLDVEPQTIVHRAWNLAKLEAEQERYCAYCRECFGIVTRGRTRGPALGQLVREELTAYLSVMTKDPLLPRAVLPADYSGFRAYDLHEQFVHQVTLRL